MSSERLSMFDKAKLKVKLLKMNYNNLQMELKNSLTNYANYKSQMNSVTLMLYRLMNGHPDCRPDDDFKKEVFAPNGKAVDLLAEGLNLLKEHAWETELINSELEFCSRVRELQHQFQKDDHFRLQNVRKFLAMDYPKFQLLESDTIKQYRLLEKAESPQTKELLKAAYNQKLAETAKFLGEETPEQRHDHLNGFYRFMKSYAQFHERMAVEHENHVGYRPASYERPIKKKEN